MTEQDDDGYSSIEERRRYRKEVRERKQAQLDREAQRYEPRNYSPKQEDFARRFNRGINIRGGDA